jgi:hypothetical protein
MATLRTTRVASGTATQDAHGTDLTLLDSPPCPMEGEGSWTQGSRASPSRPFQNLKLLTHMCWWGEEPKLPNTPLNGAQLLGVGWAWEDPAGSVMTFLSSSTVLVYVGLPSGEEAHGSLFCPVSARGVAERTPSFMYPQGTSSSQMVLRGMDLLLECIASGVYVQSVPHFSHPPRE